MLYEIIEKVMKFESEGKKIIKLNLADPDQQTPYEIIEAALKDMKLGKTKYSFSAGEKKLREELARIHGVSIENVVITPGTAFGDYKEHFRIALTAPEEEIKLGLKEICEALK